MKKITFLFMVFAILLVNTSSLIAQTYYSVEMNNSGNVYVSNPGSFAGYPWNGTGNHSFNNTNSSGITLDITNYDETNTDVGNELYVRFSRVGFGNAPLNWGSDNSSTLATLTPTDFTAGAATITVDIPAGTVPVEQTADYENGYLWILQIVGTNTSGNTYINYVVNIEEAILSTKDFQKFSSFYPNPVNDKIYFNNDVQTDSYKVLSVTGALIREVDGSSRSIDVSDLKAGLYFIATDDSVGKFVKQ